MIFTVTTMKKYLYQKSKISRETLLKFIEVSDLPTVLYEISQIIGMNKTLNFFHKAEGKYVFVPTQYKPNIVILQYLSRGAVEKLIAEKPGEWIDFRKRTTSLDGAFSRAFKRYLQKEYQKQLFKLNAEFRDYYGISIPNFTNLIPCEQRQENLADWNKLLDSI